MPSGPRQHLEQRFSEISTALDTGFTGVLADLDSLVEEAIADARRDQAEQLNQAVRRLRIAPDADELCATLTGAAARFTDGVILFRLAGGIATGDAACSSRSSAVMPSSCVAASVIVPSSTECAVITASISARADAASCTRASVTCVSRSG